MREVVSAVPSDATIDVVLATLNGARFLDAQLASIEAQVGVSWRVFVADDGSADDTLCLIEAFRNRQPPGSVIVLPPVPDRLGPSQTFGRLLAATSAPYVCLCDQDDVWHPDKLRLTAQRLASLEAATGGAACLVHSDLEVVNEREALLSPSLNRYQQLGAEYRSELRHLVVQNAVTGCTAIMNRTLVELALPIPDEAIMHDWWLALVAAAFGDVAYIPRPLVKYRQHDRNALGARRFGLAGTGRSLAEMRMSLERTYLQADVLAARFGAQLPERTRQIATDYAQLRDLGPVARRLRVINRGYFKTGLLRSVGMLLAM